MQGVGIFDPYDIVIGVLRAFSAAASPALPAPVGMRNCSSAAARRFPGHADFVYVYHAFGILPLCLHCFAHLSASLFLLVVLDGLREEQQREDKKSRRARAVF